MSEDRLKDIEHRVARTQFPQKPLRYVSGQMMDEWYSLAETGNALADLVNEDIPWLVARIRELEKQG